MIDVTNQENWGRKEKVAEEVGKEQENVKQNTILDATATVDDAEKREDAASACKRSTPPFEAKKNVSYRLDENGNHEFKIIYQTYEEFYEWSMQKQTIERFRNKDVKMEKERKKERQEAEEVVQRLTAELKTSKKQIDDLLAKYAAEMEKKGKHCERLGDLGSAAHERLVEFTEMRETAAESNRRRAERNSAIDMGAFKDKTHERKMNSHIAWLERLMADVEEAMQEANVDYAKHCDRVNNLRQASDDADKQKREAELLVAKLKHEKVQDKEKADADLALHRRAVDELVAKTDDLEAKNDDLIDQIAIWSKSCAELDQLVSEMQEELDAKNDTIAAQAKEIEALREIVEMDAERRMSQATRIAELEAKVVELQARGEGFFTFSWKSWDWFGELRSFLNWSLN